MRASEGFRPHDQQPPLPALTADSPLAEYARFAVLRHPAVEERFDAWQSEVERITLARSLENPMLTLGAEIDRVLTAFSIGISGSIPFPGKRALAAEAQSASAGARRHEFEAEIAATIAGVRSAYAEAAFNEEAIAVSREVLGLVDEVLDVSKARLRVSQVTQLDVLRVEIERDQDATEIASLEDDRNVLRARLKSALGIPPAEPDPPVPARLPESSGALPEGDLVAALLKDNPNLLALEDEIRAAETMVALARKSALPDFTYGLSATSGASLMVSPQVGITLPIFADKIDATIAAALAQQRAAGARLESATLRFVVELAEASFLWRDAGRRIELFQNRLTPRGNEALNVARTAYGNGAVDLTTVLDTERNLRAFRLGLARARMEREVARARVEFELLARVPTDLAFTKPTEVKP